MKTFLCMIFVCVILTFVFDFMEKEQFYLKNKLKYKEIMDYYKVFIPYMVNYLIPILMYMSVVVVTSKMCVHNEILTILTSGASYKTILKPYILISSVIACASFSLNGYCIPKSNLKRITFEDKYIEYQKNNNEKNNLHIKIDDTHFMSISNYNCFRKYADTVVIDTINNGRLIERLCARYMDWDDDVKQWVLHDWMKRTLSPVGEIITNGKVISQRIMLEPENIMIIPKLEETLTMSELDDKINELQTKGIIEAKIFQIEKCVRYMSPFAIIILAIMGLILLPKNKKK